MSLSESELGTTLPELMVTLAILVIITSLAIPNIYSWRSKMEARRIKSLLFSSLRQAKSESFVTRKNTLFCLSDGDGRCNKNSGKELILFEDNDNNKHFDSLTDRLILKESLKLKYGKVKLRVSAGRNHIKFFGDTGKPRGHFGHIKYCPLSLDPNLMFQVSFSQVGLIRYKPHHSHNSGCVTP